MTLHTGQQTAGQRVYTCERCGKTVWVDAGKPLPACPACGNDTYLDDSAAVPRPDDIHAATKPDLVQEASEESFPSSDAPAWTGVTRP